MAHTDVFAGLKNKAQKMTEKMNDNNLLDPTQNMKNNNRRSSISSIASLTAPNQAFMKNKMMSDSEAIQQENNYFEKAPSFVIHPYSNFRIFWDFCTFTIVTLNLIVIPMNIAFYSGRDTFRNLFLFSDVWFMLDILLNLRTGVVLDDVDMEVIFDPVKIRQTYVKGWMIVDLISSIPWDVFFEAYGRNSEDQPVSFTRFLKVLTILKLLRITRLAKALKNWEELINFQYNISNEATLKLFQILIMIMITIHINGCIQFMVPMFMKFPGPDPDMITGPCWVYLTGLENADPMDQYSWAVFKAASHMLCIGYGHAPPQCLVDLVVTLTTMLSGSLFFALMIAEITSLIQSMNSSATAYKEKITQVKEYLDFCKVPASLRTRIREYYEVKFQGKMFNEHAILDELNPLLREKVVNFNCRSLVKSVEFLSSADPDFVSDLIAKLKFEVYLQQDEIIKEGSMGNHMYFINSGTVQVTTKSNMKPRYLSEGEHFGEICLFVSNLRRTASIVATTNVAVYTLDADDFNATLKWYPSEKVEMQRVAIERMEALLLQSRYKRNKSRAFSQHPKDTDEHASIMKDEEGVLDDDIYAELEAQRDALLNLQKKYTDDKTSGNTDPTSNPYK